MGVPGPKMAGSVSLSGGGSGSSSQSWMKSQSTQKYRVAFYTVLNVLLLPILTIPTLAFLLLRKLNEFWAKYFHPDRKQILRIFSPLSHVFAQDLHNPVPRLNIVLCWTGDGDLSLQTLRQLVQTNVLEKTSNKKKQGNLEYPELTCYGASIGGYHFWKKIQNFHINDYVKDVKSEEYIPRNTSKDFVTETDLKKIYAQMTSKGWEKGKSPWEFVLINNYDGRSENQRTRSTMQTKSRQSAVIIRIHHSLADGYSILNMLMRLFSGDLKISARPDSNFKRKLNEGFKRNRPIVGMLLFPLLLPYQLAVTTDELLQKNINPWRIPVEKEGKVGRKYYHGWSNGIPTSVIKHLKNKFGVSFQAVLNSLVGGAISRLMEDMKQDVPGNLTAILPIPLPGHPGGLTNYFGYIMCRIPVAAADSLTRLQLATEELNEIANSTVPFMTYGIYSWAGLFPSIIPKTLLATDVGCTLLFSPFPSKDGIAKLENCISNGLIFTLGNVAGNIGASVTTMTFMEKVKIGITIDEQVCPSEETLEKLDKFVTDELHFLMGANNDNKRDQVG